MFARIAFVSVALTCAAVPALAQGPRVPERREVRDRARPPRQRLLEVEGLRRPLLHHECRDAAPDERGGRRRLGKPLKGLGRPPRRAQPHARRGPRSPEEPEEPCRLDLFQLERRVVVKRAREGKLGRAKGLCRRLQERRACRRLAPLGFPRLCRSKHGEHRAFKPRRIRQRGGPPTARGASAGPSNPTRTSIEPLSPPARSGT